MAKFTKKAIMFYFMELLEKKQIDKITVKDICEACEINRNTFYYYYKDIYDVLAALFHEEQDKVLNELPDNATFFETYKSFTAVFLDHRKAAIHIYQSKMQHILLDYIDHVTLEVIRQFVERASINYPLKERDIEYISKFYTYAIVGHVRNWLDQGLEDYNVDLISRMSRTFEDTIEGTIKSCLEVKNI